MDEQSKQESITHFEKACRERGLPVTTQRRTMLEMILDRQDHPTADQVYEQIQGRLPTISRTSVYRILELLVDIGAITKICHPGSAARFDPKTQRHHHLVCQYCECIIDLEDRRLDELAWPDVRGQGFEIRDYHIHFRGVCSRCREKRNQNTSASTKPKRKTTAHGGRRRKKRS